MNERIKELAKLAATDTSDGWPVPLEYTDRFAERFSQWLIDEAIDKIQTVGYKSSNDIPIETTDLFVNQLKHHFGVE